MYKCEHCNKNFSQKHNLVYHQKKAINKCTYKNVVMVGDKKKFQCSLCEKQYAKLIYLKHHTETCHKYDKVINDMVELNASLTASLTAQINDLKIQIANTKASKITNIDNSTNTNILNVNIDTVNINVLPFEKENTEYVKSELMDFCANKPLEGIPRLIGEINFNMDHPENHNIVSKNKREQTFFIADGGDGVIRKEGVVIELLVCMQTHRIQLYVLSNTSKYDEYFADKLDKMLDKIEEEVKYRRSIKSHLTYNMVDIIKNILHNNHEIFKKNIDNKTFTYNYKLQDGSKTNIISN